jgi:DNA sulfur modification protein DndD
MIIKRLELQNFRQFRDETIHFADGDKGVTVVHGSNGSGKTTLLNAFTWVLYGEVDFDTRPDRLASEGAMAAADAGEQIEIAVEFEFTHDETEYQARRHRTYEKADADDFDGQTVESGVELYRGSGSDRNRVGNPENTLDKVIPERLSELFFFDGEDIDELAGIDNQEQIQAAIQNLMGLTILERATRHLDTVASRFEDEVDEYASDELSAVSDEIADVRDRIDDLESEKSMAKQAQEAVEEEIREIELQLGLREEAKSLHNNRKRYENERDGLLDEVESVDGKLRGAVDEHAAESLAVPLIRETAEELDEMREEGSIPSGLSDDYIESLLDGGTCICGRDLEPGTEHYRHLRNLQGEAIADGVEQTALRIVGHLQQFSEADTEFEERVSELYEDREEHEDRIEWLEQKITEIGRELSEMDDGPDGETVSDLESKRDEKQAERDDLISKVGELDQEIESSEERLEELEQKYDRLDDEREEALVAKRRRRAAIEVREGLQTTFDRLKDKVREMCNDIIGETFAEVANKNFTAEVDENFKLRIRQQVGDQQVEVDKSTGERQIASLAFVGSLVKIARMRYESDSRTQYFSGGIYPLVMDSPFGALDKSHRREVSRVIPNMGNQVVVFATDSQWDGPVEEEMADEVGQRYWLDFDSGEGEGSYPQTRIQAERVAARGD